ncbi:hypothetical protein QVD17_35241 [Tagetes erecta]|uniref:Uncharacterized protein n=1 Tax=Tagetes erecta TaxID=13708 RepID=A0AAD8K126_TARER|nr:hypothetical protein QVD17_35241 [Tagetes erecta]
MAVKRGRPPSKRLKTPPSLDFIGPEFTSGVITAIAIDNTNEVIPYKLNRFEESVCEYYIEYTKISNSEDFGVRPECCSV